MWPYKNETEWKAALVRNGIATPEQIEKYSGYEKENNLKSGQRNCFNCANITSADTGVNLYCMKYGTNFENTLVASRHVCKKWE